MKDSANKKWFKSFEWMLAGAAVVFLCWVGEAEVSMTVGDLAPMIPLYVIAWRAQECNLKSEARSTKRW